MVLSNTLDVERIKPKLSSSIYINYILLFNFFDFWYQQFSCPASITLFETKIDSGFANGYYSLEQRFEYLNIWNSLQNVLSESVTENKVNISQNWKTQWTCLWFPWCSLTVIECSLETDHNIKVSTQLGMQPSFSYCSSNLNVLNWSCFSYNSKYLGSPSAPENFWCQKSNF